jgi:hypothetical protein
MCALAIASGGKGKGFTSSRKPLLCSRQSLLAINAERQGGGLCHRAGITQEDGTQTSLFFASLDLDASLPLSSDPLPFLDPVFSNTFYVDEVSRDIVQRRVGFAQAKYFNRLCLGPPSNGPQFRGDYGSRPFDPIVH